MKYTASPLLYYLRISALTGNTLFVLWILYNGIHEGFNGTLVEKASYVALICLLTTNTYLLINRAK